MKTILNTLLDGKDLTRLQASSAMEMIINGQASPEQAAALMIALRFKSPTSDELVGFVQTMRNNAIPVSISLSGSLSGPRTITMPLIDVCGTGGDHSGTFNISTACAFVLAGAGVRVAKHGNRSVSSKAGSSDVLSALGITVQLPPEKVLACLETTGFGFFFAPTFHPAMKRVALIRQSLGVRTIFNILGPLTNPAGVRRQVLGIFDQRFARLIANTLLELGSDEVMIVSSEDGLDELSLSSKTHVTHLKNNNIANYPLTPEDAGLQAAPLSEIIGGDATQNAKIILEILNGTRGPKRDVVLFNSAAGLLVSGKAKDLREATKQAAESIDSGRALMILEQVKTFTP